LGFLVLCRKELLFDVAEWRIFVLGLKGYQCNFNNVEFEGK
jgi:hypothetical protein